MGLEYFSLRRPGFARGEVMTAASSLRSWDFFSSCSEAFFIEGIPPLLRVDI